MIVNTRKNHDIALVDNKNSVGPIPNYYDITFSVGFSFGQNSAFGVRVPRLSNIENLENHCLSLSS